METVGSLEATIQKYQLALGSAAQAAKAEGRELKPGDWKKAIADTWPKGVGQKKIVAICEAMVAWLDINAAAVLKAWSPTWTPNDAKGK